MSDSGLTQIGHQTADYTFNIYCQLFILLPLCRRHLASILFPV